MNLAGKTIFIVFHTFDWGHQHDVFEKHDDAVKHAASIVMDYLPEEGIGYDEFQQERAAYAREDYAEVLRLVNVPDLDDRCNVEVLQATIQ